MRRSKKRIGARILASVLILQTMAGGTTAVNAKATKMKLHNPKVVMNQCDIVYFGSYWQEDTNKDGVADQKDKKTPVKWRILSKNGDDAYVIADKVLDYQKYNNNSKVVTWETCTLRKWLNEDFYNAAFTKGEQEAVLPSTLENANRSEYGVSGENNIVDRVFLSSFTDMQREDYGFYPDPKFGDQARIGKPTAYAVGQGMDSYNCHYWLRSQDSENENNEVEVVQRYGCISDMTANKKQGVRPTLHLKLSSSFVRWGDKQDTSIKSVKWDTVELGTWRNKPITWMVLEVTDKDIFLLSADYLEYAGMMFDSKKDKVTWEKSSLRKWMNGEFYQDTFSKTEKKGILKYAYRNKGNSVFGTKGRAATKDYVTLLSLEDVVKMKYGFPSEGACWYAGRGTHLYAEELQYDKWWLRSSGRNNEYAVTVDGNGSVDFYGNAVKRETDVPHVRPALHFSKSAITKLQNQGTMIAQGSTLIINHPTIINLQNKKSYKTSKKVTIKDLDGIALIELNGKVIKGKNKRSYSFKFSKYKKNLKKGNWNEITMTDRRGNETSIQFKIK